MAAFETSFEDTTIAEFTDQTLLRLDEVFIYRVPPLATANGYRADEWGLANPLMTGALRVVQRGDDCFIRLFGGAGKDELFATCPLRIVTDAGGATKSVEAVIDSSRYFVLRCEDARKRAAYIGVGVRDREASFSLKAAIGDFESYVRRHRAADDSALRGSTDALSRASLGASAADAKTTASADLSITGTITVNMGNGEGRRAKKAAATGLGLAPPPPSGAVHAKPPVTTPATTAPTSPGAPAAPTVLAAPVDGAAAGTVVDDDDFGDFESA